MIVEPGDPDRKPLIPESTCEQTNDELTASQAKQLEADDQAILIGLPENIYAAVDSYNTAQWVPQTESNTRKTNVKCYNCNAKSHYARDCPKPKVRNAKYFREQMLLEMKDIEKGTLNAEENDFMLDNTYGDDTLQKLTAAVIMMAENPVMSSVALVNPRSSQK
nr:hypothetical protein [Tanacetum cinerariifolium]